MTTERVLVVSGSQNLASQSAKVGVTIAARLATRSQVGMVEFFDLAATPLPLLGAQMEDEPAPSVETLRAQCQAATGFAFVTPEWHGMVPAALKNFFLHYSRGELAHKPALLVAVSASAGGAYPIAELRGSSYKNSRICYLPEHLIIRNVNSVFNDNGENNERAYGYLSDRLDYCLDLLTEYCVALSQARPQFPDASAYANGM